MEKEERPSGCLYNPSNSATEGTGDVSITGTGEYEGPFPFMLDLVRERLKDTPELVKSQSKDPKLSEIVQDIVSGGTGGDYVLDDKQLLWYSPVGSTPRLAIPHSLKAGIMALVHTTYGHPGEAKTIILAQ